MLATLHVTNPRLRLLRDRGKVLFQVDAAGQRSILRLDPQDRLPLTMLQIELAWLTLLHDQLGLPVPGPLPAPDGRLVVPYSDPRGAWYGIRLRWTAGHVRSRRISRADAHALGTLLARLHRAAAAHADPVTFPRWDYTWDEVFGADRPVLQPALSPYRGNDHTCITAVGAHLDELLPTLGTGANVYGLIHSDVNLTNVLWRPDGPALIDFDYCGYGYYLWDVGRAALQLRALGKPGVLLRRALLDGYATTIGHPIDAHQLAAFEAMNVVDILNWLLEIPAPPPWKSAYISAAPHLLRTLLNEALA